MRAAVYVRVSTFDQEPENQLQELRRYVEARGWTYAEFVDRGVSGAKDRRPVLDELLKAIRRRKVNVVVVWSLDRLGRSLRHLIALLDEFQHVGVGFVSLREGLDCTTPAGRLQWQIIGAISEFERARIQERVKAGLQRARAQGKRLGRPRSRPAKIEVPGGTVRAAAVVWGVFQDDRREVDSRGSVPPSSGQTCLNDGLLSPRKHDSGCHVRRTRTIRCFRG